MAIVEAKHDHDDELQDFFKVTKNLTMNRWENHIEDYKLEDLTSISLNIGGFFKDLLQNVLEINKLEQYYDDQLLNLLHEYAIGLKLDSQAKLMEQIYNLSERTKTPVNDITESLLKIMDKVIAEADEEFKQKKASKEAADDKTAENPEEKNPE